MTVAIGELCAVADVLQIELAHDPTGLAQAHIPRFPVDYLRLIFLKHTSAIKKFQRCPAESKPYGAAPMPSDPQFEARPHGQVGQGWCVHVTWPSGKTEVIAGFGNQYSALDWIRRSSANWVADKIMQEPGDQPP